MIMECEVWTWSWPWHTYTVCGPYIRMDHKILHLVCIEAEGDIFRHPNVHVLMCYVKLWDHALPLQLVFFRH